MDQAKIDALTERIVNDVNGAMSCLNVYLGHRLGLFQALSDAGPATPLDLAAKTGYQERYLREWLECMAVGDFLGYDEATGAFSLSPEHAVALLDRDSPAYATPFVCYVPSFAKVLDRLLEAFRSGGGVPYEAYGADTLEGIGSGNRPMYVNDYVARWIPAMPDVEARLRSGGRVAEVGCGLGWSSISLAKGFPRIRVEAVDVDDASIAAARRNTREAGVDDRITFHRGAIEEIPLAGPFDLVTAFECLHDMPYPVRALRRMRELAAPAGAVLIADEAVGDSLQENRTFVGRLNYNFSVLHCLPQAMVFPESAGIGTVIRPSVLKGFAHEAGFSRVDVLPIEHPLWRFYRLTV
jgi:2-polyprenyl-3-methyl-5-hydroxy-6-metoxy-1,4-benzoquinol methylase